MKAFAGSTIFASAALLFWAIHPQPLDAKARKGPGQPYALSVEQKASVEKGVRARLKDPESARFRSVSAVRYVDGMIFVCGWVNARNSFGGYTGDQPFNGVLSEIPLEGGKLVRSFGVAGIGGSEAATGAVMSICKDRGVSF